MKKIEIILADADSLFTDALRAALRGVEDFEVSAADGGAAGLREVFVRGQGIVVIHRQIPDAETIHMLREGKRDRKELRALLIVKEPTGDLLSLAGENAGIGVMSSSSDIEELVSALRSLARGERYVSKKVLAAAGGRSGAERLSDPLGEITPREREVLYWLALGLTNKEISKKNDSFRKNDKEPRQPHSEKARAHRPHESRRARVARGAAADIGGFLFPLFRRAYVKIVRCAAALLRRSILS